ncbi:ABC transporter ATP-binding protein/permease [Sphingomonas sp. OTU376]|uniref:ABC transporter ATP-binding protein/permease n=1 Tax=Sphingomonas sp. OTU376 TaxID=3043863 RepID=UPI00313D9A9E
MIWLLDVPGAALFAGGIALAVSALAAGDGISLLAACMILAGGLIRGGAALLVHATAIRAAQRVVVAWRSHLFPRLLAGRLARPLLAGESAALAIDHMATIEAYQARFRPARAASAATPLLVAAIIAFASWVSAAILVITLIPFALGMILAGTAARRTSERQLAALAQLSGLFVDRVRTLPVIRHFGAEDRITRQVGIATGEVAERTVAVLRVAFLSGAVLEFFAALSVALVAVYCGFSLLGLLPFPAPEKLTLGQAFFALAMAPEFYLPMRRLAAAYHEKQLGDAASAALTAVEAETPAPPISARFDGLQVTGLVIQWPNLHIGPVSFALAPADMVALTGPTGSGKSSLLASVAGQIVPAAGAVRIAGGGALDPGDIAWAAQTPLLLPGTLAENIALARPDATIEAIGQVASLVGLDTLLAARGGLGLALDHRGSGLSGGERRRIGLARAILSGRPLLLCDEPTADLDAESAAEIIDLLKTLARDRAVLVVTHDPALAAAARLEVAL